MGKLTNIDAICPLSIEWKEGKEPSSGDTTDTRGWLVSLQYTAYISLQLVSGHDSLQSGGRGEEEEEELL